MELPPVSNKTSHLAVIGPLPPPYFGVAVSTSLVLENAKLKDHFEITHIDTSDPRNLSNFGVWDTENIRLGLVNVFQFLRTLRGRRGVLYLAMSESWAGFVRDSLFVMAASLFRWKVAIHIRNSGFRAFYFS